MSSTPITRKDVRDAFGEYGYNQLSQSPALQKVRSFIHSIGKLFGIRIYGKVILDAGSVIYINKCHLSRMTSNSVSWKKPGFVENFKAYVKITNVMRAPADYFYRTRATQYVRDMLARNNPALKLTIAGEERLDALIANTLPKFKTSEGTVKQADFIARTSLLRNLTADEKKTEALLLDDIKKVIFKEAREIFIRGQEAQRFTQEINQI